MDAYTLLPALKRIAEALEKITGVIEMFGPRKSETEKKKESDICPHFYLDTDGIHICIVERCNHSDKDKWKEIYTRKE